MIVGITGVKGAGKDTAAQYFVSNCHFVRIGFADKLKEAVANLFGITVEQVEQFKEDGIDGLPKAEVFLSWLNVPTEWVFSWREFLQRFGTEMGRNTFGQDFWVNVFEDSIDPTSNIVIPDVRFNNEARICSTVIEIVRPGYEPDGHESEAGISNELKDYRVVNSGTVEQLNEGLEAVFLDFLERRQVRANDV